MIGEVNAGGVYSAFVEQDRSSCGPFYLWIFREPGARPARIADQDAAQTEKYVASAHEMASSKHIIASGEGFRASGRMAPHTPQQTVERKHAFVR